MLIKGFLLDQCPAKALLPRVGESINIAHKLVNINASVRALPMAVFLCAILTRQEVLNDA
jgi:hypothetical protein